MAFDKQTATVLGGGSWGTALAHILASHGYPTMLWLRRAEGADEINSARTNSRYLGEHRIHQDVTATTDLALAARHSDFIIVAIPSKALRKVAYALGEHLTGDQVLVSATKGIEAEHFKRMSELLREETCVRKIGALSGPNLAKEIMAGEPAATVVASRFEEVIEKAERRLAGPRFRLYGNFDIIGVELAGALKNVTAIAAGMCAGLGFGSNALSMLITRGMAEMSRMGCALGAERLTFMGLAGMGDLIATCSSTLSRNHTVGRRLVAGESLSDIQADMHMVAEGVNTTVALHRHAARIGVEMPMAEAMYGILFEQADIDATLNALMSRRSRYETSYSPIHEPATVTGSLTEVAARAEHIEPTTSEAWNSEGEGP